MSRRGWRGVAIVAVLLACAGLLVRSPHTTELARAIGAFATAESPSDRYAARVRMQLTAHSLPGATSVLRALGVPPVGMDAARAWLLAHREAAAAARAVRPSFATTGSFTGAEAAAWRFPARRGHRVTVDVTFAAGVPFVDLETSGGQRLSSAASGSAALTYDVREDADLVLRVQPPIGAVGEYRVAESSGPSMTFPVQGVTPRAIQSVFGAQRDAGRRLHEGVDIFAPRGTPVVAATAGWIGNALTNGLGGNVIWVWNPLAGTSTYYAHLDRQEARPGQRVTAGDVVGYVGNTGNARGGPTHLHFGIYITGEGSVDPLPFVCGADCRGTTMTGGHRSRPARQ